MTHSIFFENNEWNVNTLDPPSGFKALLRDLSWHVRQYREAKLNIVHTAIFIVLRIIQISGYKKGWYSERSKDRLAEQQPLKQTSGTLAK